MQILISFILLSLGLILTPAQQKQVKDEKSPLQPLNFTIMNKGESIKIQLQNFFPFSETYSIYDHQSSANIQQILNVSFSYNKIQNQASQTMVGSFENNKTIDMGQNRILDIKTIYNQPNKLFLLQNNILMMYSYRQKSQDKPIFTDQKARNVHSFYKNKYFNQKNTFKSQNANKNQEKYQQSNLNDYPKITVYNISSELNITGIKSYNISCLQMQALPLQAGYKLIVLCKLSASSLPQTRNYIVTYNMQQSNKGFITNLKFNSSNYIENNKYIYENYGQQYDLQISQNDQKQENYDMNAESRSPNGAQLCQQYHLKYFNQLVIEQKQYFQTVIAFCNSTTDSSSIKQLYQIGFYSKGVIVKIISNPSTLMNVTICLINSKYVTEFQNGFISVKSEVSFKNLLRMFKYSHKINAKGKYETQCQPYKYVNLDKYQFITSRNQSGIETIYVIFSDRIYIFQSYSPNYQTLSINSQNLTLISYAISNEILSLHFQDKIKGDIVIKAYNIKSIYPHLIDRVQYSVGGVNPGIYLFSVMNYLQKGNFFFIYQRDINVLNLTYYSGQFVNITIKDPAGAVGLQKLAIANTSKTNIFPLPEDVSLLPVYLKIRAFCDTSIETVQIPQIRLNSKLFNIDLVKAVIGPLGRFYKMPNSQSSLQFVNSFHEIDITNILNRFKNKKLMTFSIDDFLNFPIMTFYFEDFMFLKCDLEFDFNTMRPMITRCFEVVDSGSQQRKPQQIIIYEQDKFIQHQGRRIYFCRIQSSRDTTCIEGDFERTQIKKIKLIKYSLLEQTYEFISVFIIFEHSFKQKDYTIKVEATQSSDIKVSMNVEITQNQIEYLKDMTIKTIEYDEGYENFLLLYMMDYFNPVYECQNQTHQKYTLQQCTQEDLLNATYFHIIQIYSKPQLQPNQQSHFIGHLIAEFTSTQLDNVFIIDNKILLLYITPSGSNIEEYRIVDFKCVKVRNYPLYDHIITKNGSHTINSGFLFVQVEQLEQQVTKYLVYNPSMNTTNIITHSFQKINDQRLLFIQKMTPSQNVMAIHGNKLITLSLPNIVVKLNQNKRLQQDSQQNQRQLSAYKMKSNFHQSSSTKRLANKVQDLYLSDSVNVSFIDNNDVLKLLSFQYSYDLSDSKIQYSHKIQHPIRFKSTTDYFQLAINATQIIGPVSEYNIVNLTQMAPKAVIEDEPKDICQFIEFNSSDIFTKTKCIKYFNSKQDGIMQDFITFETGLFQDVTILVTDKKILCIENMIIRNKTLKNKTKDCNMFQQDSRIFIICTQNNSTTMNMLKMSEKCQFTLQQLAKPEFLKYNLFNMMYSRGQAVFEVPIRSKTNMIYYLTSFDIQSGVFDQRAMLLKHQSEQEFSTRDFELNDGLMFMLEDGLGIFNLSKRNDDTKKIVPDDWIDEEQLMQNFQLQEQLSYVNCLEFNPQGSFIILQIGTTFHSFQTLLEYEKPLNSSSINIKSIQVNYIYKNPWSCYNTLLSKSRYYKNMTIKMCSFQPEQHYIFSNFIPISDNKQNSYIIFYQKNFLTNKSYPFRMDIIYTNIYSNDNFQIPKNKANLLIGSLFNLLCEYDLRDQFLFNFTVNPKIQDFINEDSSDIQLQKQCHFRLNLSNQNYQTFTNFTIKLDFQTNNNQYWTDWKHWIQRVFFIAIIANYVRLEYKKRAQTTRRNRIKVKRSRTGSFDQQFDIHVRFLSKKSL